MSLPARKSSCCSLIPSFLALALASVVFAGPGDGFAAPDGGQTTRSAAASPQLQVGPNQQARLDGELEIIHEDFKDGGGQDFYTLTLADGTRVPLRFIGKSPTRFLTGDRVRVSGQLSGGSFVLYSGGMNAKKAATTISTGLLPYTLGPQSTLVILVNFEDDAVQPYTIADAQNMFFGSVLDGNGIVYGTVNDFFIGNSYGQTSLVGDVAGWYTIPVSVTTCDVSQIAADARVAATSAGVNLSSYARFVYAFPLDPSCGFGGASDVGGNPSESWINSSIMDYRAVQLIDHELGHAFGLEHSHLLDCGTTATICSAGTIVEYGDRIDTMGEPQTASPDFNAFQKERLGWLGYGASPSIETVQTSGAYLINPYELGGPGPNALKVLKSFDRKTGVKVWYYLENRQAIGFDAFLTNPIYYTQNETAGVLFHIGTEADGNSSDLLDMTPATPTISGWLDMSLAAGETFQDSTAGVTFTVESVTPNGAVVDVQFSGGR
ncbi:MAG TPA: hypothetical protein VGS20_05410 [Candidatus Acidoferrales bacterium]|nr:hypothetical protein [Candidatus Acidoferrales bacterium]